MNEAEAINFGPCAECGHDIFHGATDGEQVAILCNSDGGNRRRIHRRCLPPALRTAMEQAERQPDGGKQ